MVILPVVALGERSNLFNQGKSALAFFGYVGVEYDAVITIGS